MLLGGDGAPPALAGALAAWFSRAGQPFSVVDALPDSPDPFIHLEAGVAPPPVERATLFGPGTPDVGPPGWRLRPGDPEPGPRPADLGALPITTWTGFDWSGPDFRVLAGRGDRCRPVAHVLREIAYLVEMRAAGHFRFDDEDLLAWTGWLDAFRAELAHLPWRLTWEGRAGGRQVSGRSRPA